jgi:hypothetical protein
LVARAEEARYRATGSIGGFAVIQDKDDHRRVDFKLDGVGLGFVRIRGHDSR